MTNSANVTHVFYEVGSDLLAKPTALTQLIEGSAVPATIVFCNSASDTDLVEVLLKKRGVSAQKLIGNVSPAKIEKTLEQLASGELSTVVATDASAKNINIDAFDLLISYTSPSDVDTYQNRFASETPLTRLKTVATLVNPNDLNNFEFVQQSFTAGKIVKADLPTAESLQKAKITRLKNQAIMRPGSDEKYKPLIEAILADSDKATIIGYLLANTMEVIPSLQSSQHREEEHFEDDDGQPNFNGGHGGGNDRYGRGNDRGGRGNDRGGRGNDRGGRGNDRSGRGNDRNDRRGGGNNQRPQEDGEAAMQAREAQARTQRRPMLPPLKEARIYLGKGTDGGLSEASIKKMVQDKASLTPEDVRRVIVRKNYAFFDVLEEQAGNLLEKLDDASLLARKATVISTQQKESREDDILDTAPTLEEAKAVSAIAE